MRKPARRSTPASLALTLVVTAGLSACEPSATPSAERADNATDTDTGASAPQTAGAPIVQTTAEQAAERGLPAANITIDPGNTGLEAAPFPADNHYLALSGPPGGPLGLTIERVTASPDAAGLKSLAELRFEDRSVEVGAFAMIPLAGADRPAIACTTDESMARAHHLLALIPAPQGGALLVDFYRSAGSSPTPAPSEFLEHERFGPVLRSLQIDFE